MLRNLTNLNALTDQLLTDVEAKTPKIQTSQPLATMTLVIPKNTYFLHNNQSVKKITMLGHFASSKCQLNADMVAATRLIFQLKDETQVVLQFKNAELRNQFELFSQLHLCGGIPDHAFTDFGIPADDKDVWAHSTLAYQPPIRQFYDKAHVKMAELVLAQIMENPNYLALAKNNGITILSLGCGDGKDMKVCREKLLAANFDKCTAMGFDSSEKIIEKNARQNHDAAYTFIHSDIQQIAITLSRLVNEEKLATDNQLVVVIAAGSFTRHVLDGTSVAHGVLKQLASQNIGHILIATGWTKPLLTEYSATAAGWRTEILNECFDNTKSTILNSYHQIFVCNRQSNDEEFDTTLSRSLVRAKNPSVFSLLDLSLTSNPLTQCMRFLKEKADLVPQITQIDLSWSHLSSILEVPQLHELLNQFKNMKIVTISGNEKWAGLFIHQLQNNASSISFTLIKRTDSTCKHELPTLPVHVYKQLNVFTHLPNETALVVKANTESKTEDAAALLIKLSTVTSPGMHFFPLHEVDIDRLTQLPPLDLSAVVENNKSAEDTQLPLSFTAINK